MKPSLVWRAPRHSLRRGLKVAMALAPLVAVSACCGQTTAPREVFDKSPSPLAEKALVDVLDKLSGSGAPDGPPLEERLRTRLAKTEGPISPTVQKFLADMKCRPLGCYTTLPASSRQEVQQIEDLVTNPNTPLRQWGGWRYLSGLYEQRTSNGVQRVQTVVLLEEKPVRQATTRATTKDTKATTQGAAQ
jgi:hypothetical protein